MSVRVRLGASIFDERFSAARIERMLSTNLDAELSQLEKGAARDEALKIRKVFSDVARDVSASQTFKEQYAEWLASQLSEGELKSYLEFLQSELGKKTSDLDLRVQPLVAEAIERCNRGRLETITVFLAEARNK
jgi:hypothetical protein